MPDPNPLWTNETDAEVEADGGYHGRLAVAFGIPEVGWVQMAVLSTTWLQSAVVLCSSAYDPFWPLYEWLDQIADRRFPAELTIDEEGTKKRLTVTPARAGDEVHFRLARDDGVALVRGVFRRTELVRAFVDSFGRWLAEVYDPCAWAMCPPDEWDDRGAFDYRKLDLDRILCKLTLGEGREGTAGE